MKTSPRYRGLSRRIKSAWGRSRNSTNFSPTAHEIKAAIAPREFYRSESATMSAPKRDGWVDGGLCPNHDDHNTGNFRVNTISGAFKCHACGAGGGDIIAFLMRRPALHKLAEDWGVFHV